jgi:RNA polymerase sigma factor (sigma-70 family)
VRSDAELLASTRTDPAAFAEFYDRYESAVVAYFARRVRDAEVAADLTAEVFAAMLAAAPRYRPVEQTAAGWVFTIAHNTLSKSTRRGRVEARARARIGIREAVSFDTDELERVDALASGGDSQLTALLERLPGDQAAAIRARVLDERGYPEIAAELQTSELVIRKRVSRGLATIRRQIEKEPRP